MRILRRKERTSMACRNKEQKIGLQENPENPDRYAALENLENLGEG